MMLKLSLLSTDKNNFQALQYLLRNYSVQLSLMKPSDFDARRYHRFDANISIIDLTSDAVCNHESIIDTVTSYDNVLFLDQKIEHLADTFAKGFVKQLVNKMGKLWGEKIQLRQSDFRAPFTWVICGGAGGPDSLKNIFSSITENRSERFIVLQEMTQRSLKPLKNILEVSCRFRPIVLCDHNRRLDASSIFLMPPGCMVTEDSTDLALKIRKEADVNFFSMRQTLEVICRNSEPANIGLVFLSGSSAIDRSFAFTHQNKIKKVAVLDPKECVVPTLTESALAIFSIAQKASGKQLVDALSQSSSGEAVPSNEVVNIPYDRAKPCVA